MKTEKFGPYECVIVNAHIRLNRRRTIKDYTDIITNTAITLASCLASYFVYNYFLQNKDELSEKLILWFLIAVFILLIYISLKRLFHILFLPLRDIIHLDKKGKVVNFRMAAMEDKQVALDKILRLEYGYQDSSIHPFFIRRHKPWPKPSAGIVYARTKEKKRIPFLLIREPNFQYWSNPGLLGLTRPLVERLGELLEIPAKFHRHISIDHYTGKES